MLLHALYSVTGLKKGSFIVIDVLVRQTITGFTGTVVFLMYIGLASRPKGWTWSGVSLKYSWKQRAALR